MDYARFHAQLDRPGIGFDERVRIMRAGLLARLEEDLERWNRNQAVIDLMKRDTGCVASRAR